MTIALTGASGHLGRSVAALLDPADVVLLTRSPEALEGRGAQVRRADFDEPGSLAAAFEGVDRLLLISAHDLARQDRRRGPGRSRRRRRRGVSDPPGRPAEPAAAPRRRARHSGRRARRRRRPGGEPAQALGGRQGLRHALPGPRRHARPARQPAVRRAGSVLLFSVPSLSAGADTRERHAPNERSRDSRLDGCALQAR